MTANPWLAATARRRRRFGPQLVYPPGCASHGNALACVGMTNPVRMDETTTQVSGAEAVRRELHTMNTRLYWLTIGLWSGVLTYASHMWIEWGEYFAKPHH